MSGIDFVRIGAVGNAPWPGNGQPVDRAIGRGGVDYEYHIGRFEVTTAQWVEFLNAALDRPAGDAIPFVSVPGSGFWGGTATAPMNAGGRRFRARAGQEMFPAGDIDWRMSAVYCNWLHNGKSLARSAFLDGAYDVSTFGYVGNRFTDQLTHHPDARYWIPTWDEWLKAAHYDPAKDNGDGTTGGWWVYSNGTDTPLIGGPPGVGQANFGFSEGAFTIPLGAYPQTLSPWGLLDVAGGTIEWTETTLIGGNDVRFRVTDGSWRNSATVDGVADATFASVATFPHIADFRNGLRMASAVPAPTCILSAGVFALVGCTRRRR